MRLVDEDFDAIRATAYERKSLYYDVKIDQRITNIVARKAPVPIRNNAKKITFLINTPQDDTAYTSLYLSDVDIITLLSTLDTALYEHIKNYLVATYRTEKDPVQHSIQFSRPNLAPDVDSTSLLANHHVLAMPVFSGNPDLPTAFGFTISFQSFCDLISLILSRESKEKLPIVIAKYCILSGLTRPLPHGVHTPASLRHISTMQDVEKIYADKRPQQIQKYDAATFTPTVCAQYFSSI